MNQQVAYPKKYSVQMTEDMFESIKVVAKYHNISIAELVRAAIDLYLVREIQQRKHQSVSHVEV